MRLQVAGLGLERGPLGHAESMLLVHDRQPEPFEGHPFADHRVGADHHVQLSTAQGLLDVALLAPA